MDKPNSSLARQYGGGHTGSWVEKLPAAWIPFVQLARLSPPTGVFLVAFPHMFGALNGILSQEMPPPPAVTLARKAVVIAAWSFFLSNAIHGWNDLIDAPIDKLVARTKSRPIVRGAVSSRAALLFTFSQVLAGLALLLVLPAGTLLAALPSVALNIYYPFAKRHTHLVQFVLGAALAWGVVVGTAALDVIPWRGESLAPTAHVLVASTLWTVIYDTIYAFQDVRDDVRIGVKSMAVLLGSKAKPFLWLCLASLLWALGLYGAMMGLSLVYYLVALGGCAGSLGAMIFSVDLQASESCWWWFGHGFWFAGLSITGGLLSQVLF